LLVIVAALALCRLGTASGDQPSLSISGVPGSVSAGDANLDVQISVAGVTNLGAYEWQLSFDPNVVTFVSATNGGFLGSTHRSVTCWGPILPPSPGLEPGNVRFGCVTYAPAPAPAGPSGSGLLSTVTFQPVGNGAPNIGFVCAALADPFGEDIPISNVGPCVAAITPTPGPSETPEPAATPGGPTATPGGATATPIPSPAGPTATPPPLPPGLEAVHLAPTCNAITSTYADETNVVAIANAVLPTGILESLWKFDNGFWLGFSPRFPEASDLAKTGFLDVVFVCVSDAGFFIRPVA
jgi:hypothetical protein